MKKNSINSESTYITIKSSTLTKFMIILCFSILSIMAILYMGMAHQMQLERQSVTGLLYMQDKVSAKKYADIIMLNHVNKYNASNGILAMDNLGYSNTAFINNANQYPINLAIILSFIGCFLIFIGIFAAGTLFKKYVKEFSEFKLKYEAVQSHLDGINACLQTKNKQMKSFIENIAHQIRTPISFIYLTLDESLEKWDNNNQSNHLLKSFNESMKCIDKIKDLLNKLLDIARLESGKTIINMEEYDISAFIADICQEYSKYPIELQIGTCKSLENIVHIDPEWFREAFINILNNAIEHSDEGQPVHVNVIIDNFQVQINIANYGDDIAESDLPYIFDRFYTAENVLFSHTGIGLNLSSLIISRHNGTIRLTSANRYTEFQIHLPKYKLTSKIKPSM